MGGCTSPAGITSCWIIFKGVGGTKFTGMISWGKNLGPMPFSVNGFNLWLNVKKNFDVSNLTSLADEVFKWSEADYGYIMEANRLRIYTGNMYTGLYNLKWINYFGKSYLAEEGFNVPESAAKLGHGIKLQLTDCPDDKRLYDLQFLNKYYSEIGDKWFWHFDEIVKDGKNYIAHLKEGFHQGKVSIPRLIGLDCEERRLTFLL